MESAGRPCSDITAACMWRICLRILPIAGVDDVTKPVRERVRMRAAEIDDVAAIDYIRGGGSRSVGRYAAAADGGRLGLCYPSNLLLEYLASTLTSTYSSTRLDYLTFY